MNQLDMMSTLVDAARQLPENTILERAIKQGEKRIEVLRERYRKRGYGAFKDARQSEPTPPRCKRCSCRFVIVNGAFECESCGLTL
jgi:hypothetical protein